jgi:hypothetical protein
MDINDLEKSFSELQEYSDNQFRTINSLKKEIDKLKEENKSLKLMVEGNVPPIGFATNNFNSPLGISNEQLICETQLTILKDRAITRELTFEEAKKFAIFSEILTDIKINNSKSNDIMVEQMPVEDLLKLVEGGMSVDSTEN